MPAKTDPTSDKATIALLRAELRRLRASADRMRAQLQVVTGCDGCMACALQARAAVKEAESLERGETERQ